MSDTKKITEAADSGLLQPRLVRRLLLVVRRMLFVVLILPIYVLTIFAWILILACEILWIVIGYISGRTEHEWLEWTETLQERMQKIWDSMIALNSPPNDERIHGGGGA